ncbi:MAG: flagellar biosynthesis protein FlhF [Pseudomonadota bacterium]
MKMKRFLAPNMREALKAVRTEQGPDAVILSNRRVGDYIEIIAALDYDEALIKQALQREPGAAQAAHAEAAPSAVVDQLVDDDPVADTVADAVVETATPIAAADVQSLVLRAEQQRSATSNHRHNDTHVTEMEITSDATDMVCLRDELADMKALLSVQVGHARWQQQVEQDPQHAQLLRNYTQLGIADDVANQLIKAQHGAPGSSGEPWREPVGALAKHLPVTRHHVLSDGGIAAVIGPTGVGKTTTIAKLAAQFALQYGSRDIALISMDSYRVGAREQLRQFGRIIGATVFEAKDPLALRALLPQLSHYRMVLIDTAGVSQRDARLAQMLDGLSNQQRTVSLYLAMSATADAYLADEIVRCYSQVPVSACVLTKVDEACRLGAPLSVLIRHQLPLAFICDGQHVPDDLHLAASKRLWLVNRAQEYAADKRFVPSEQHMAETFGLREVVNG